MQISIPQIESKIKEIDASTTLTQEKKSALIELFRKAISQKQLELEYDNSRDIFKKSRVNARNKIKTVSLALKKQKKSTNKTNYWRYSTLTTTEFEQILNSEKANLSLIKVKLDSINNKLIYESGRPAAARERLIEASRRQDALENLLLEPIDTNTSFEFKKARKWAYQSEYAALQSEMQGLDQEILSHALRVELLEANKKLSSFKRAQIENNVVHLEHLISGQHLNDAKIAVDEAALAKKEAKFSHYQIQGLANDNASLSNEISESAAKLEALSEIDIERYKQLSELSKEFQSSQKQLQIAGFSQTLGHVLLERKRKLKNLSSLKKEMKNIESDIANTALLRLQHEDELSSLKNSETYIDALAIKHVKEDIELIRPELSVLITARTKLLQQALDLDQSLITAMSEIDTVNKNLYLILQQYYQLLDERLLWIRNIESVNLDMIKAMPREIGIVFSLAIWKEFLAEISYNTLNAIFFILSLCYVFIVTLRKPSLIRRIVRTSQYITKASRDKYSQTVKALILTLALTLPWALLFIIPGYILLTNMPGNSIAVAIGQGLVISGQLIFFLLLLHYLCIEKGLAQNHFKWSEPKLNFIRKQTPRFIILYVPSLFFTILIGRAGLQSLDSGLGLVGFILIQSILSYFIYKLVNLNNTNPSLPEPTLLNRAIRAIAPFIPFGLIVLAITGYFYGAITLTKLLTYSLWFILTMIICHQMLLRWLNLAKRRLSLQAALDRRALARKQQEEPEHEARPEESLEVLDEPEFDIATISRESKQLLNVSMSVISIFGLGIIWQDVLSALSVLSSVTLWHRTVITDGVEALMPVTMIDGLSACLILMLAILAARKLPAFLEIAILQRLSIDSGSRYAIKTLTNYTIIAITVVWVTNLVGLSWGSVQWLVAALGVGIGFGLQEIIANFISGIIILFERPIRVGDIVTIGETDGVVTRIQIRATTIRGWDRKELLVPNKEFITGRLLNWTLSDATTRIMFSVGVAYGSNVEKAMQLIKDICHDNEKVLTDPAPFITFDEFGDNSLSITVRCYLDYTDYRVQVTSELHLAIYHKFNEAEIVISYPQRDIHLDTTSPLDIRLHQTPPSI
ncbi:MAG: mechanosensitive ion channel [Sinobacterium sp.]|nr:mechanosensitive ion channel [Sinobacterium sp.]